MVLKLSAALALLVCMVNGQFYFTSPYSLMQGAGRPPPPQAARPPPPQVYAPPPVYNPTPSVRPTPQPQRPVVPSTPPKPVSPQPPVSNDIDDSKAEEDLFGLPQGGHSHFGYTGEDGPDNWKNHFPACGGTKQSPIDINPKLFEEATFPNELTWTNYWEPAESMTLENNGHSMEVSGVWKEGKEPTISGGPLNGEYVFRQLHFHWGLNDTTGSEHTIAGQAKPMEMHAVHWKKSYGSYEEAIKNEDGLAVTGYLWAITQTPNFMLESFIQHLPKIAGSQTHKIDLPRIFPLEILDLSFTNRYATYSGSLTTPPCSEIVTWLVRSRPLTLSREQMIRMRSTVKDDDEHMHNYRPIQPLNDRVIKFVAA